ncbi:fasciclin domain-containing protein [Flavobacterium sp.]|uniref:fasciclin domain-containing protein n=1 Tax=Flavobacterium sp. TaxID=239 RepID=UPI00286E5BFD|nr:fasciclin domain-containing protein [Flavobacterium sp.]
MKIISNLKKIALFAFVAVTISSCNDDDAVVQLPVSNTISALASRNANLTILVQALTKAELVGTLNGSASYTVFAPTDDAFRSFLTANQFNSLNDVPPATLKEILLNHVVTGSVQSTALVDNSYIKTLAKSATSGTNTMSMYVKKTGPEVKLNGGAVVTTPNVLASNGVIHIVDKVIDLPTIVTHAAANPAFSTLATVVTSAAQAAVKTALSGAGPLTVFAPTNAAFTALDNDPATPGGIAAVSAANITKVLFYHAIPGNNLAASLTAGSKATALPDQSFILALTPTVRITDVNLRVSNVTPADVQCSNGVIHILDKVLLPTL